MFEKCPPALTILGDEGYDYGEFGGVSLEDAAAAGGDDDDGGYDYGNFGGVSLEDAAGGRPIPPY